jgi:hypothetical protein
MAGKPKSLLAHMRSQFEMASRKVADAAIDFNVPDDKVLELRSDALRLQEEVRELEHKSRGLLGFLGF